MTAFYNEIDPYAAQWLRNIIDAGHIAPGVVDERSIEDIEPAELAQYTQCHFFAGIGVWSLALRKAGWPDGRPVWTGSCPCQPFSAAGKGAGFDDERHLWPAFHHLISQCRPATVIGEQVASKDADPWIDLVQADLERMGYAFGAVPFPSASVGAPHIRDRLYWVADSNEKQWGRRSDSKLLPNGAQTRWEQGHCVVEPDQQAGGLANNNNKRLEGWGQPRCECGTELAVGQSSMVGGVDNTSSIGWNAQRNANREHDGHQFNAAGQFSGGLADSLDGAGHGSQPRGIVRELPQGVGALQTEGRPTGPVNGRWADADWLFCRDGKWRPVEPGTFPLANGAPARVGRLRAYGNAINAIQAQIFIEVYMEGQSC